ncbi:hypothetical protein MUP07_07840 [Candidatus Bathyarchaeota archaeon]|nr:hypothetical protein [Candidatus Bathyarchaeota archaeon]
MRFVRYNGPASGYLLILTDKSRENRSISSSDEHPTGIMYVPKEAVVAVSDLDFEILRTRAHIGKGKLEETTSW